MAAGRPAPRVPVPLRPMNVSDVIDGAWTVLKVRPGTILGLTAAVFVPLQIVSAALQLVARNQSDFFGAWGTASGVSWLADFVEGTGWQRYAALGVPLFNWLGYALLGAGIAHVMEGWYAGRDVTAGQALRAVGRRLGPLLAIFVLLLPVKALAAATCLGTLVVVPLFCLTSPAIMIERLGPIAGAKRSATLVGRRLFPVMGVIWLVAFIVLLVVSAFVITAAMIATFIEIPAADLLMLVLSGVAGFFIAPVVVAVNVLLYLDLRVRREGLDLELEAHDAFAAAT